MQILAEISDNSRSPFFIDFQRRYDSMAKADFLRERIRTSMPVVFGLMSGASM